MLWKKTLRKNWNEYAYLLLISIFLLDFFSGLAISNGSSLPFTSFGGIARFTFSFSSNDYRCPLSRRYNTLLWPNVLSCHLQWSSISSCYALWWSSSPRWLVFNSCALKKEQEWFYFHRNKWSAKELIQALPHHFSYDDSKARKHNNELRNFWPAACWEFIRMLTICWWRCIWKAKILKLHSWNLCHSSLINDDRRTKDTKFGRVWTNSVTTVVEKRYSPIVPASLVRIVLSTIIYIVGGQKFHQKLELAQSSNLVLASIC